MQRVGYLTRGFQFQLILRRSGVRQRTGHSSSPLVLRLQVAATFEGLDTTLQAILAVRQHPNSIMKSTSGILNCLALQFLYPPTFQPHFKGRFIERDITRPYESGLKNLPLHPMKWFCHIFSLYLLTLSCLPCSDGDHDHVGQSSGMTVIYVTSGNGYPSHEQCNDVCSPFCGCHCCTTYYTIRALPAFAFQKDVLIGGKTIFSALFCLVKDAAFAIDHPPQLV